MLVSDVDGRPYGPKVLLLFHRSTMATSTDEDVHSIMESQLSGSAMLPNETSPVTVRLTAYSISR
jgi:hypothetical protein